MDGLPADAVVIIQYDQRVFGEFNQLINHGCELGIRNLCSGTAGIRKRGFAEGLGNIPQGIDQVRHELDRVIVSIVKGEPYFRII